MTRAKVCGVTTAHDRDLVVEAGADAVGVVVDVPVDTPREISPDRAATLVDGLPPFVTSVLVTMPSSVQAAARLLDRVEPDAIQVHGGLGPAYVGGLRARTGASVIAGIDAGRSDVLAYADAADALLVDSTDESGGGGTGETHDWTRARDLAESVDVPLVLAGGLTPENVREAVETVRPFAVDVATGVERTGGRKDPDAVRRFVGNATRPEVSA